MALTLDAKLSIQPHADNRLKGMVCIFFSLKFEIFVQLYILDGGGVKAISGQLKSLGVISLV